MSVLTSRLLSCHSVMTFSIAMFLFCYFYQNFHFNFIATLFSFLPRDASASRGIEIACRPSVRLSVRLSVTLLDQDHIGWKSWKLITRTLSPTPSLFVAQGAIHLLPGEHGEIWGRVEVGWEKVACWKTKAAISLKRVKIEEKLLGRVYRKSRTLFRTVPSTTSYGLRFP